MVISGQEIPGFIYVHLKIRHFYNQREKMVISKLQRVYFAITFAISVILGGCGGGGDDSDTDDPLVGPLTISTNVSSVKSLGIIELQISGGLASSNVADFNGVSGVISDNGYLVEIDITGNGNFNPSSTYSINAYTINNVMHVPAPMQRMIYLDDPVDLAFAIRIIRESDGAVSNTLFFNEVVIHISPEMKGIPSTVLDLILKAILLNSGSSVSTDSASFTPGLIQDSIINLDQDINLLDQQAEAILRSLFNYSAIENAQINNSLKLQMANNVSLNAQAFLTGDAFSEITEGYREIGDCFKNLINTFPNTYQSAADGCLDISVSNIRDRVIPGIGDLHSELASVTQSIYSFLSKGVSNMAGGYIGRVTRYSEMTQYTTKMAKVVLSLPGVGEEGAFEDLSKDYISDFNKKFAEQIVDNYFENQVDKVSLETIGFPEKFDSVVQYTTKQIIALNNLENEAIYNGATSIDWINDIINDNASSNNEQITTPFGDIPIDDNDPYAICNDIPGLGSYLGLSCQDYVKPFLDQDYLEGVLRPLLEELSSISSNFPGSECFEVDNIDSVVCQQLLDEYTIANNIVDNAIIAYVNEEFECTGGYNSYQSSNEELLTCIHSSIVYTPPDNLCFDGSVRPQEQGLDIGNENVCMYFSRDYFNSDVSCKVNYSKVFFMGAERCRWSGIPISQAVAQSVNSSTGYKSILIH